MGAANGAPEQSGQAQQPGHAAHAGHREPLNRDRVLRAAVALADQDGMSSLSMRKLGEAVGVEAMSLYNHVASKIDLLDGMIDVVFSEIDAPAAGGGLEAVQDQVQAGLELVGVVVAGLDDVGHGYLGEVGILPRRELLGDLLRDARGLLTGTERQAGLLQGEPVDVTIEQRVRVRCQLDGEAGLAQAAEHGVVVVEGCGTW